MIKPLKKLLAITTLLLLPLIQIQSTRADEKLCAVALSKCLDGLALKQEIITTQEAHIEALSEELAKAKSSQGPDKTTLFIIAFLAGGLTAAVLSR